MQTFRHIVVFFAGFALTGISTALGAPGPEVRGTVGAVDTAKNELRLEGRGPARGSMLFTLDDKTLVLFGAQKGQAGDLQPGRRVRIEYEETADGQRIARVIHAIGRPPLAPVAAARAPAMPSGDALTGVLQRVSRSDREIVVIGPGDKGAETESTIAVPEGTKIVKDGKEASLGSLKEGDAVAVRVERRGSRLTALEVQAGPGAALPAAAATTERSRLIPRLRQALHVADEVLKRLDTSDADGGSPKKP